MLFSRKSKLYYENVEKYQELNQRIHKSTNGINKPVDNGKEVTNPIKMADIINNLYVNIGENVEEKIPKANKPFLHSLTTRNPFNIVLNTCTNEENKTYVSRYDSI